MGTEYVIFNHTTKTWLDLGKGHWCALKPKESLLNMTSDYLDDAFLEFSDDPRDLAQYLVWVCCKVYSFVRTGRLEDQIVEGPVDDVEITSDCGPKGDQHATWCDEYEKVGDRYINSPRDTRMEISRWLSDEDFDLLMSNVPDQVAG